MKKTEPRRGKVFRLVMLLACSPLLAGARDLLPPSEMNGASPATIGAAQKATTSTDPSEIAAALAELRRLMVSAPGNPHAALAVGYCEEHGLGTTKSLDAARESYGAAAEGGSVAGMRRFGKLLRIGTETSPPDPAAAREWLGKADAANDPDAALELGRMNYAGEGLRGPDLDKARFFFCRAAEAGSTEAMVVVGQTIKRGGFGGRPGFEEAMRWFKRAEAHGDPRGSLERGLLFQTGSGVRKDVGRALALFRKAAEIGLPEAFVQLGGCALQGVGGEKDELAALEWFRKGAKANSPVAMFNLATYYDAGLGGVERDATKAIAWLRKSAELGHLPSQNRLGSRYRDGQGVAKELAEAFKWYSKAAQQRFAPAIVNLGMMYEQGYPQIVAQDPVVAARLYTEAARQKHPAGEYFLARLLVQGSGVQKDPVAAYVLATESARHGYKPAGKLRDGLRSQLTPEQLRNAEAKLKEQRTQGN